MYITFRQTSVYSHQSFRPQTPHVMSWTCQTNLIYPLCASTTPTTYNMLAHTATTCIRTREQSLNLCSIPPPQPPLHFHFHVRRARLRLGIVWGIQEGARRECVTGGSHTQTHNTHTRTCTRYCKCVCLAGIRSSAHAQRVYCTLAAARGAHTEGNPNRGSIIWEGSPRRAHRVVNERARHTLYTLYIRTHARGMYSREIEVAR